MSRSTPTAISTAGHTSCHWTARKSPALPSKNTAPTTMSTKPKAIRRRSVSRARAAASTSGAGGGAAVVASAAVSDAGPGSRNERRKSSPVWRSDWATSCAVAPADAAKLAGGRPATGMRKSSAMYARTPMPPKNAVSTKKTRTSVASTARYSAMPPQTPEMTRSVPLRSSRSDDIERFPPASVFERDREDERRQQRDGQGRLLEDGQGELGRDRAARDEHDRIGIRLGEQRRRQRAQSLHRGGDDRGDGERGHRRRQRPGGGAMAALART